MITEARHAVGEWLAKPGEALSRSQRQGAVLEEDDHRPWPLPDRHWIMGQTWEALMFCHWRVDREAIQRVMPPQFEPERYDGDVWLGVTPFVVRALRLRGIPPLPVLSSFPEINVRTYVTVGGKPGIYFFSLDAASRPAVAAARRAYRLPYFRSAITATQLGDTVSYRARRLSDDGPAAAFEATYGPVGPRFTASPGTLEHFLTERYCLYTLDERQTIYRGDIHHPPWPLQPAEAEIETNTMASGLGLALDGDPVLHFAARQDVALWRIQALD